MNATHRKSKRKIGMEENKTLKRWKITAIIALCGLLGMSMLYAGERNRNRDNAIEEETTGEAVEPLEENENWLSLWNEDARAKNELESYMKQITDENNPSFIPVENRIAVFDLDGTLYCETDPTFFDNQLFMHRVLEDEDYRDKASESELATAAKIRELIETGKSAKGLEVEHGKGIASSFAGMTLKEFNDYVRAFREQPAPGYDNMKRGDAFYLPMVEIVDYLQENDFTVYIVSGTDRLIVRGICDGISFFHIPANRIIGSDELITTKKQGDTDGLDYVFTEDDELIMAGEFIIKNLKMNKVSVIAQEIGIQPVLSFGNSTGDSSMAEYVTSSNPYKSLAFMLCCDDTVRENGNETKARQMRELCEEFGWIPISMKDDWKTIYGDEVTRK